MPPAKTSYRLWRVPNEWDDLGHAGFIVMARDAGEAIRKAKVHLKRTWKREGHQWPPEPYRWEADPLPGHVYTDRGNDG